MNKLPIPTTFVKDFNQDILDALIKAKENLWMVMVSHLKKNTFVF